MAALIAQQLSIAPPKPFESIDIVVHTWSTSRWLSEQLAITNGVNAQIQFPFPRAYLRKIVQTLLDQHDDEDPWKAKKLVWPIIQLLPEFIQTENGQHLGEWLRKQNLKSNQLNKCEWQLARSIADAFDDYILYRPELVDRWITTTKEDFHYVTERLPKSSRWQPELFRLIDQEIKSEPFGKKVEEVIMKIKTKEIKKAILPAQLNFFGLSRLAPIQIKLIKAIASITNVQIFLITPCPDLWKRCVRKKDLLITEWSPSSKNNWLVDTPRIESNLGKMGAEFQNLLEGSGENQLSEQREIDLFASPTSLGGNNKEPSLLEQIQENLIQHDQQIPLKRKLNDSSLVFYPCPGKWREVQVVRDQIIQWLAEDSSLEPRDILIMTPQLKTFSPLISSVFNDKAATGIELPWRIANWNPTEEPGLIQFVLNLIKVASDRLTASSLESLLGNKALQEQKGMSQEEINSINSYLQLTGFRWGVDKKGRGSDATHSLDWCLERWLLGVVVNNSPNVSRRGIAPYSDGINLHNVKRWWTLLSSLSKQFKILRLPHTCEEWVTILKKILEEFFGEGGSWSTEKEALLVALEDWRQSAQDCKLKIEAKVILEVLKEAISTNNSRYDHLTGAITISEIQTMRALPYRAIVMMGLDAAIFPTNDKRAGFNLLEEKHYQGDPRSTQQDRYVILEALISSRKYLMISWNSRDERTGEVCPPSSPIQQLVNMLKNELDSNTHEGLIKYPDPNPLDRSNFTSHKDQKPISCDKRNLNARLLLDKNIIRKPIALALPLSWNIVQEENNHTISNQLIESWLISPQLIWLENMNIKPREWILPIEDLEALNLNELERYKLLKNKINQLKENLSSDEGDSLNEKINVQWDLENQGKGIFPTNAASKLESDLLDSRLNKLQSIISQIGPCKRKLVQFGKELEEIIFTKSCALFIEPGRLKAKIVMQSWLMHLKLSAYQEQSKETIVITRSSSFRKNEEYQISLKWLPLSSNKAQTILDSLRMLTNHGLKECWPIPPESGWALAKGRKESRLKGDKEFIKTWNGGFNTHGECRKEEMYICFGINCKASIFLENKEIEEAFSLLYDPIIETLSNQCNQSFLNA